MQIYNANSLPPADLLCAAWALTPVEKLLTTTARNYKLEAALQQIAAERASLFPTTAAAVQQQPKE